MKTRQQMKESAVKALKQIKSYGPYTNAFKNKGTVTMYEGSGGYYVEADSDLDKKIKEVEEKYNGMVYAAIHNYTEFGEIYTLLWEGAEDETIIEQGQDNDYYVFAYVWNVDEDMFSEFGDVIIKPMLGGLIRIG